MNAPFSNWQSYDVWFENNCAICNNHKHYVEDTCKWDSEITLNRFWEPMSKKRHNICFSWDRCKSFINKKNNNETI